MIRTLAFAAAAVLLSSRLASAQSYYPPATRADTASRSMRTYRAPTPAPAPRTDLRSEPLDNNSASLSTLADTLSSPDYVTAAGNTTVGYIRRLYLDVIGREPLPAEINYWAGRLSYESRRDVAYQLVNHHPRNRIETGIVPSYYNPDDFPDPAGPRFRDPSGPFFRSPYFYNYEKSRSIRAFSLGAQG